jgi:hypothetical protein
MTTQPEATPPVAGAHGLQEAIDRLDGDINSLVTAIRGMASGNGTTTTPSRATQADGATFTTGVQGAVGGIGSGWGSAAPVVASGSGGTSGANPFSMGGGATGGLSGVAGRLASTAISGIGNYVLNAGANSLNNQAQINTYGYVQASFYGSNPSVGGSGYQGAIGTAFGSASSGRGITSQNNMALNATDARFGASILSSVVGSSNYVNGTPGIGYGTTAAGNGGMTSPYLYSAGFAMANPGLGMESSAQLTQNLMSPTSSYNLRMMGVGTTPLQYGTGKANNPASVLQSIGTRFGIQGNNPSTGTFNSQSLAANLNSPLFQYQMEQAMGMSPQQYQEWANSWTQQNTAVSNFNSSGKGSITMSQMQDQMGLYMNGTGAQQKQAQQWLTSHGVSQSMLQSLTQANAGTTATQSGQNQAFVTALQNTTTAIQQLNNTLSNILTLPAVAGAEGASAAVNTAGAAGNPGALGGGAAASAIAAGLGALGSFGSTSVGGPAVGSTVGGKGAKGATVAAPASLATVPGKGASTQTGFITAVLTALGAPATAANIASMKNWMAHEEPPSDWNHWNNPMNTTQPMSGSKSMNSVGVQSYPSITTGLQATVETLNNGLYGDIIARLKSGSGLKSGASAGLLKWSGDGYSSVATGGTFVAGERGPEMIHVAPGTSAHVLSASQTASLMSGTSSMPAQVPWSSRSNILSAPSGGSGTGQIHVHIQKGAVQVGTNYQGYNTTSDTVAQAAQLTQALESSMMKSQLLQQLANGVTG